MPKLNKKNTLPHTSKFYHLVRNCGDEIVRNFFSASQKHFESDFEALYVVLETFLLCSITPVDIS